jgi:hypothetical protein
VARGSVCEGEGHEGEEEVSDTDLGIGRGRSQDTRHVVKIMLFKKQILQSSLCSARSASLFFSSISAHSSSLGNLFPSCVMKSSGFSCIMRAHTAAPCATTSDGSISVIKRTISVPTASKAMLLNSVVAVVDASPVTMIARISSRRSSGICVEMNSCTKPLTRSWYACSPAAYCQY